MSRDAKAPNLPSGCVEKLPQSRRRAPMLPANGEAFRLAAVPCSAGEAGDAVEKRGFSNSAVPMVVAHDTGVSSSLSCVSCSTSVRLCESEELTVTCMPFATLAAPNTCTECVREHARDYF